MLIPQFKVAEGSLLAGKKLSFNTKQNTASSFDKLRKHRSGHILSFRGLKALNDICRCESLNLKIGLKVSSKDERESREDIKNDVQCFFVINLHCRTQWRGNNRLCLLSRKGFCLQQAPEGTRDGPHHYLYITCTAVILARFDHRCNIKLQPLENRFDLLQPV